MDITITNRSNKYYLYQGEIVEKLSKDLFRVKIYYFENILYDKKMKTIEKELQRSDFIIHKEHEKEIPKGHYCYFGSRSPGDKKYKPCKYWGIDKSKPSQDCGFCTLTNSKDWLDDDHLWDQLKSCGINEDND